MVILLTAAAWAADWSASVRVDAPTIPLEAGEPLYLSAAARPDVRGEDGAPVALTPTRGGWVVPADDADRVLHVDRPVTVRRLDEQALESLWNAWELSVGRAARRGDPAAIGPPPAGGAALAASARVRALAVDDPAVARLGALHDAAGLRRLAFPSHAEVPADQVRGPAIAALRAAPRGDGGPIAAALAADDEVLVAIASTSRGAARTARAWLPPGDHAPEVRADAGTDATVRVFRTRGWLARPSPRTAGGIAAAELAWLNGARDPEAFRAWLDDPGPRGALARARFVASAAPAAADDVLARWTGRGGPDAATALADGALGRADLDESLVAAAVLAAPAVTATALAAWLDRDRPRAVGAALIDHAAGAAGPSRGLAAARRALLDRRFGVPIAPNDGHVADVEPSDGPGAARVAVGSPLTVVLPAAPPRWPVLRLEGGPGAVASVDGSAWPVDGRVAVALAPGPHVVAPVQGRVWLVDPALVDAPAVSTLTTWTLPATWDLPGAGEAGTARVAWAADAPVIGAFDDGTALALPRAGALVWREVPIPADARSLTLSGVGRAAVLLPTPRRDRVPGLPTSAAPGPTDAASARVLGRGALADAFDALDAGRPASALALVTDPADVALVHARLGVTWSRVSRFDDAVGYVALPAGPDGVAPLAARVVPSRPATVRLAADQGVVRVHAVEGTLEARVGGRVARASPGFDAALPLIGTETLTVTGDGVAQVALGLPREAAPVAPEAAAAPRLAWAEALARVGELPTAERLPGAFGSLRARVGAVRTQHVVGDVPYVQAAAELAFLRADPAGWWYVEAWVHAPRDALGLEIEHGWRGPGWRGFVAVAAGRAREHGSVQLDARVLRDWPVTADVTLRAEGFARAVAASKGTGLAVDPRAWTAWEQAHPLGAGAVVDVWARPWRDVRLEAGLRFDGNTGPGGLSTRPYAMAAWLIDPKTSVTAEARVTARLPDAARPDGAVRPSADLRLDRVLSATPSRRWSVSLDAGWRPRGRVVGGLFVECLWSDARGSRDLRPDEDAFRALRAVP